MLTSSGASSLSRERASLAFEGFDLTGEFSSLDQAIEAALKGGFDLATAVIEKRGFRHSVNEWISFHIAGGDFRAG